MEDDKLVPNQYKVSPTPHIRAPITISQIMLMVLLALAPSGIMGIYFFGLRSLLIIIITMASCMAFEALYQKLTKQQISVTDLSAALTGLLLAFNLPPTLPLWMPIVGSFVAIVIAKQLFGGLGQNFINPALAGRAFLTAAYMPQMLYFVHPVDTIAGPTPLAVGSESLAVLFIGIHGGTIGETSAIALILGGLFLIWKKVITWHVPFTFIGSVFLLTWLLGGGWDYFYPTYQILSGGLMLGAFFMATDYSTSPITTMGKIIMGLGCGFLTVLIRLYGGYPEGVTFAILLMNLCVPLIDKFTKPRVFGVKRKRFSI